MLRWANRFNIFCFLDNQDYSVHPHRYDCLLGLGSQMEFTWSRLAQLEEAVQKAKLPAFGHFSYELKTELHGIPSTRIDPLGFPNCVFFIPLIVIRITGHSILIDAKDPDSIFMEIERGAIRNTKPEPVHLTARLSREEYLEKILKLQQHIVRGDCYEINFCQEFYATQARIDPVRVFEKLAGFSPNPFSALYRFHNSYLICASPERFLFKNGRRILSQPMKGTSKRDGKDVMHDDALKKQLQDSAKDRSENVMIVDLVRNDLSRICEQASVTVDELFSVYSYPGVHQMISTVSGMLREHVSFPEVIQATFPMGSMTGAPKYRVMELIDQYELSARGIFSGSLGYMTPDGDFDLNVVIRSIMYNEQSCYLSYQVGSGITFYSEPEKEWEECLLKAEGMRKALEIVES